ncbi:hypothetical protein E1181_21320 [Saccharopolyspora terrae]|uniref:DUF2637 domain-containing protein n=1 Tax=Saccharopolyspora terrae TaxID=2530384 RepID=A0A4R4VCE0_9PSEU|nr:hypothetical protein [Saccharopolyspora terrae]TDD03119.1 hypothetical protein E1181_21320 [Saccharopolyspora terrae]
MSEQLSPVEAEEQRLLQAGGMINLFVWLVASVVMVFSAFAGAELLAHHGVPWGLGLAGGLAVDAALVVALIGDRQLHRYGQRAPWGTGLRWATAGMSLVLNCGQSAERGDWVAAGLHAIFPVLLIVLTEASQGYQIAFSRAVSEAKAKREYQQPVPSTEPAPVPVAGTCPVPSSGTRAAAPTRTRRSTTRPSTTRSGASLRSAQQVRGGQWDAEQWKRAVELVAAYQCERGRDPKLGEFHSELRMSRNAASPLRNAVLSAVSQHGADAAKSLTPGAGSDPAPVSAEAGTEPRVIELSTADTAAVDTAESIVAN